MVKNETYKSLDSLDPVIKVLTEAGEALKDERRTSKESPISEVLAAALGAGVGGAISFSALWSLGVAGLSAAGITSALAAMGAIVGGGMAAGIFVAAAPIAVVGTIFSMVWNYRRRTKLNQEKEALYKEALKKHNAIINMLYKNAFQDKERIDYLYSLVVLLEKIIQELETDLKSAA